MEENTKIGEEEELIEDGESVDNVDNKDADEQPPEEPKQGLLSRDRFFGTMLTVLALAMVAVHLMHTQIILIPNEVYLTLHMAFSFAIMFAVAARKSKSKIHTTILLVAIALCVVFTVYIATNLEMLRVRAWVSTNMDLVIGMSMIILAMYAAWLGFGPFIPILVAIVVIYPFFGQYLPEPFTTISFGVRRTISNMSIGLRMGLFDATIAISANFVFLFAVFGGLLNATGVQSFFFEFGKLIAGRFRSGPAQITIINSGLIGLAVGSAVANVSITGPQCIPAMKKAGYKDTVAAAIQSVASNGGQITPPVMGIIAFAMAGFAGIPYWTIVTMALIPAGLYYFRLSLYAHLQALKIPELREKKKERPPVDKDILKHMGLGFFIPFIVIIAMLASGYSVMMTGFWAIVAILVTSFIRPKRHWPSFKGLIKGFVDGAIAGAQIGAICAVIGMLVATFIASGLGVRMTSGIAQWSGGHLLVALFILYAVTILAGMIGVSVAAYFTTAAFAVPVMVAMGMDFQVAHFFLVYPASLSTITPPVALVVLIATKMAKSNYGKTVIETCKVAAIGFLTPFLFAYAPVMLLMADFGTIGPWIDLGLILVLNVAWQVGWVGYFLTDLHMVERIVFLGSCFAIIGYLIVRNPIIAVAALALIILSFGVQVFKRMKRVTPPPPPTAAT